jgi:hypothetical protein
MSRGLSGRRLFHGAVVVLGVLLAALGAVHAAVSFFGLTFPDRIGDAQIGQTHDFEKTNPGLGYGVGYVKPGWTINIYIYDLGRTSIPDDVASDALSAQMAQAHGDIFELQKRGDYDNVELTGSRVVRDDRGRARFACEDFTYGRKDIGNVDSYLCLTGWNNKFVKFRLTTAHGARSAAVAQRFVEAWLKVLWP